MVDSMTWMMEVSKYLSSEDQVRVESQLLGDLVHACLVLRLQRLCDAESSKASHTVGGDGKNNLTCFGSGAFVVGDFELVARIRRMSCLFRTSRSSDRGKLPRDWSAPPAPLQRRKTNLGRYR